MIHQTQVHYLVQYNDQASGREWYLKLIRDSEGQEKFDFTLDFRDATFMNEHTANEKLHSCKLHFDEHCKVKKLQIDYRLSDV